MKYFWVNLVISGLLGFLLACNSSSNNDDDIFDTSPNVQLHETTLTENSLVLAVQLGQDTSYLVNKQGAKLLEWTFSNRLGNDLELLSPTASPLLPNGGMIGMFKSTSPSPDISFGGFGGIVKLLDTSGNDVWEYEHSSDNVLAHHDVELLPNGNVLFIAWERVSAADAQAAGIDTQIDIFPEVLIEVNPDTDEIIWEWHSFDHLVPEGSSVPNNPQLIDFNYNTVNLASNGDILHANAIEYDAVNDIIYLSVNFYHEVWAIDHSTTTEEARNSEGGNRNKGGNLLYRFGNPEAYGNTQGQRIFYNNHHINTIPNGYPGAGNVLVYVNGNNVPGVPEGSEQSFVYELDLPEPDNFNLQADTNNEPEVVWSFTSSTPRLYNRVVSGAMRLQNGNTLICEGDYGFWEVTPSKEVVWLYNDGSFWRGYEYQIDATELEGFTLPAN